MTQGADQGALLDALERAGYRLTEPRRVLAGIVAGREGHFTAADLVADARRGHPGIGRATIFRALEVFTSLDLVGRVDLPAGDHAYVTCDPIHHHHAICTGCGRSLEIDDLGLAEVLTAIGARSGFQVNEHRLEVFGTCAGCATPSPVTAAAAPVTVGA